MSTVHYANHAYEGGDVPVSNNMNEKSPAQMKGQIVSEFTVHVSKFDTTPTTPMKSFLARLVYI